MKAGWLCPAFSPHCPSSATVNNDSSAFVSILLLFHNARVCSLYALEAGFPRKTR